MIKLEKITNEEKEKFKKKVFQPYWDELVAKSYNLPKVYSLFYSFWEERNLVPFWIKEDDKNKGFMFVGFSDVKGLCIEQFYIDPKYRGQGIGMKATEELFASYPGDAALRVRKGNEVALAFWSKVINKYSDNRLNFIKNLPINKELRCNCEELPYSYELTFKTNLVNQHIHYKYENNESER